MAVLTVVRTSKNRYLPDIQHKGWKLGQGGCSTTVERYYQMGTNKLFAVKKMPKDCREKYDDLLRREFIALRTAKADEVPRVITCFDPAWCTTSPDDCLLLELVEGSNLSKHMPTDPQTSPATEPWMLQIASQLVDTLWELHSVSKLCHMDLSPDNIMLRSDKSNPWDTLRLIDFGFAAKFNPGPQFEGSRIDPSIRDVKPPGATAPYASPEVLRSLQLQFEGAEDDEEGVLVSGCLADMWSLACILYEMLTGEKPFMPSEEQVNSAREAPATVPKSLRRQWQLYDVFAEAQRSWLEAAQAAVDVEGFVSHPLLDRINECSTRPTEALDFFSLLFWPVAEDRLLDMAPWHRYIEEVSENLEASALQKDAPTSEGVQQIESTSEQASSPESSQQSQHAQQEVDDCGSDSDDESNFESESGTETEYASACESFLSASGTETDYNSAYESSEAESETESFAEDELLRVLSSSAPAAIRMELNIKAEAHSVSTDRAAPSPPRSISLVSSQQESTGKAHHAQQGDEDAPSQGPSDVQLSFDSADAMAGEAVVSVGQASGVSSSDSEASSIGHSAKCQQESAQHAPAVATAEHSQQSRLSSLTPLLKATERASRVSSESTVVSPGVTAADEAAASGASPPDSKPLTSDKLKPVQKLKKLLSGKLRPSCMRAARTRTDSHQQELTGLKDKSMKSQKASNQVQLIAIPADVSTISEQQQQQQPSPPMAGGNKQRIGKLTGFFKLKKAASKSAGVGGVHPQSVQEAEPSDLIPAVTQPSGVVQQADSQVVITTAEQAAKPSHQAHTGAKQKLRRLFCLSGQ